MKLWKWKITHPLSKLPLSSALRNFDGVGPLKGSSRRVVVVVADVVVLSPLLSPTDDDVSVPPSLVLVVADDSRSSLVLLSVLFRMVEDVWSGPIAIEGRGSSLT